MASDVKSSDLLYISSSGNFDAVTVYSYPKIELVGTLKGFNEPQGECVDRAGDVFVTNTNDSDIVEYAHGGTSPTKTLSDSGYYPVGCAIDPTTGNLGVTNIYSSGSGPGSVSIYKRARGLPATYRDPNIVAYYFCGYDDNGNLYLDGANASGFAFAELPNGSNTFVNITLNQTIYFPGGVQWDGSDVAVGDQEADDTDTSAIYQFAISGDTGTEVGETPLTGAIDVVQFWIQGGRVIGPDAGNNDVGIWTYPSGRAVNRFTGVNVPVGSVVSEARK